MKFTKSNKKLFENDLFKSKLTITDIILFDDISNIDLVDDEDLDGAYKQLNEEVIGKYTISSDEVQNILDGLKNCTKIVKNDYFKTNNFLKTNNLTLDDCIEIIHNLKISDYYANFKSTNEYYLNNTLIVFEPKVVELSDGRKFSNLVLYLKIDLNETTKDAVALVSLHKGRRGNLPYSVK